LLYFVSDLHLADDTPGIFALFRALLARIAKEGNSLYILGDLFEVWIGDDDDAPLAEAVSGLLSHAALRGLKIFFLHGNRDFLLGKDFAQRARMELLPDPYCLEAPGAAKSFLLTHGDMLCTEDAAYQAFRRQVRGPLWQQDFLHKPVAERRQLAAAIQKESSREKGQKADYLMDVGSDAVADLVRQHGKPGLSPTLLHGHTHRPDRHQHLINGLPVERWVLADWSETRGECLVWDGEALRREALLP